MSLKSIDMQLAMSRSMDASQLQNQTVQKTAGDQFDAAMQAMKQQELERTRSNPTEKPSEGKIRSDDGNKGGSGQAGGSPAGNGSETADEQAKPRKAKHPFKGKFIDLSL